MIAHVHPEGEAWGPECEHPECVADRRTCRDCGAVVHEDEGGVVADPRVSGSWLCERCMAGYEPCDHCMRACDPVDLDDDGHCADCADELRSERDTQSMLRAWLARA